MAVAQVETDAPVSEPAPKGNGGIKRAGKVLGVIVLAIALFAVGSLGLFRAIRSDDPAPPPVEAIRQADPALQSRPVIESSTLAQLIASLQARLNEVPGDWRAYASLGLAYVQQARITADPSYYPKAEGALNRSLELNREENFQALLGMGSLALARHDFAAGLSWGQQAQAINPANSYVYGVIGDAQIELGRYQEAFETYQQMVDLRPDLSSYARASYARELQGDTDAAIEIMELAFDAAGTRVDQAWTLNQLGDLTFNAGRIDQAEQHYRRALAADPSFVPPQAGLARVAAARGELAEAIAGYEAVVATYALPEYVISLIDLYTVTGRQDEADRQRGLLEAEETLLRSNGVNVDLEFALFSADHRVDLAEGLAAAEAEWAKRESIHVADALAWQLYANGRHEEALGHADQALALGTRNATFLFHRGMIHLALSQDAAAREDLQAALDINPHFSVLWAEPAAQALASLGGSS